MQPLPQRTVLAGVLHDLLRDDAAPEGAAGRDLRVRVQGDVGDQALVDLVDLELALDLHLVLGRSQVRVDNGDELRSVFLVEGARQSLVDAVVLQQGVQDDVQLLRPADLVPTAEVELLLAGQVRVVGLGVVLVSLLELVVLLSGNKGVGKALLESLELHQHGDLHLLNYTVAFVRMEVRSVSDRKAVFRFDGNLEDLFIDFSHSLHFSKGDEIAIFKSVQFLFAAVDDSFWIL